MNIAMVFKEKYGVYIVFPGPLTKSFFSLQMYKSDIRSYIYFYLHMFVSEIRTYIIFFSANVYKRETNLHHFLFCECS